jgi:polygalacturonase
MRYLRTPVLPFVLVSCAIAADAPGAFDVTKYGAAGDGKALDSPAINKAIDAASAAGGGTVYFPAGTFLSGSIHLKSNIALYLDQGAVILAASDPAAYDAPEPNQWDKLQDFGHSHFHNSLIWGENLENISILGTGRIYGKGLVRSQPRAPANGGPAPATPGNKAIALKLCRNVTIKDVSILMGGWFAILATGVDNMTIDGVKIDTNRDGMDIDSDRNVRISNVSVNSPYDDGICLKSDYALGFARADENITITNSQVTGYDNGTFLDGTYQRNQKYNGGLTGRVKFGTESNGGFKNITISNVVFEHCRGLALETVDGGLLEDIAISNITMRDISNAPIFLRLGERLRAPEGTPVGALRRVLISNVTVYNADPHESAIIAGIPGHDIENVKLNNIRIYYQGGGTKEQAAIVVKEDEKGYPEPKNLGDMPAYGFFIRHVKGIELNDVHVSFMQDDARPAIIPDSASGVQFRNLQAQHAPGVPALVLNNVEDFRIRDTQGVADTTAKSVKHVEY